VSDEATSRTQDAQDPLDLSFEELRDRAFQLAEERHDYAFFWDLIRHMPGSAVVAAEDGSPGEASGSILETIATLRELFASKHLGEDLGTFEPLFRARFADYIRTHG
jgi:hypothetical protein